MNLNISKTFLTLLIVVLIFTQSCVVFYAYKLELQHAEIIKVISNLNNELFNIKELNKQLLNSQASLMNTVHLKTVESQNNEIFYWALTGLAVVVVLGLVISFGGGAGPSVGGVGSAISKSAVNIANSENILNKSVNNLTSVDVSTNTLLESLNVVDASTNTDIGIAPLRFFDRIINAASIIRSDNLSRGEGIATFAANHTSKYGDVFLYVSPDVVTHIALDSQGSGMLLDAATVTVIVQTV